MKKIILGSASKWRSQILKEAGFVFNVMNPNVDEKSIRNDDPQKLVLALAYEKAKALIPQIKDEALLITLDQIVVCNNEIFEKPESEEEARKFMNYYNKYKAQTVTAVVVTDTLSNKQVSGIDIVNVIFNKIPDDVIDKIIADGEIFSCAGGFQIEDIDGKLNPYIESIDGYIDSVKGFPIVLVKKLLEEVENKKLI